MLGYVLELKCVFKECDLRRHLCRTVVKTSSAAVGMGIPMGIPVGMGMGWIWGL